MIEYPKHWFKPISEFNHYNSGKGEPEKIEYLKMWSGETFIHTGGTAFWDKMLTKSLRIESLHYIGVTHYRILE